VEWLNPSGEISTTVPYAELPSAQEICLASQLPVAGFPAASQPGTWTVRVLANNRTLASKQFQIVAGPESNGVYLNSVTWVPSASGESDLTVRGQGFQPGSILHIAQYTSVTGWRFLASLQPASILPTELTAHYGGRVAAEYLAIVETPDLRMSRPVPFLIATGGYKLPMAASEPWVLTQGPYGAFSHWGNSLHAFDIAPISGRCVVAMKAGIVHTFDRGLKQDHAHRSFGNYITIDHGNGEYSHYAHLASGTFVVADGQRVEQGQALATAGNSGYTLGEGGGYHVHVHVTRALPIASQSIPFQFEDLPGEVSGDAARTIVSENYSPLCDCRSAYAGVPAASSAVAASHSGPPPQFSGSLSVEQWWSELVSVPRSAKSFDVTLAWKSRDADLDLHIVSPSGRHYSRYTEASGFSSPGTNPQRFGLPQPEPGLWRISIQAVKGGPSPIEFDLSTTGTKLVTQAQAAAGASRAR